MDGGRPAMGSPVPGGAILWSGGRQYRKKPVIRLLPLSHSRRTPYVDDPNRSRGWATVQTAVAAATAPLPLGRRWDGASCASCPSTPSSSPTSGVTIGRRGRPACRWCPPGACCRKRTFQWAASNSAWQRISPEGAGTVKNVTVDSFLAFFRRFTSSFPSGTPRSALGLHNPVHPHHGGPLN
jgi:hypothetical protein